MTGTPPLRAVRRALSPGPAIDPYELAGPDGIVFDTGDRVLVGIGRALVIPLAGGLDGTSERIGEVSDLLRSIECDDPDHPSGSGVIAFGALPFDRSEPTELIVPRVTYSRDTGGSAWVTVIGRSSTDNPVADLTGSPSADLVATLIAAPASARHTARQTPRPPMAGAVVEPLSSTSHFLEMVAAAVASIRRGELAKVVLARQVDVHLASVPDIPALLTRWRDLEPNCTVFSMPTADGRFVGASPELLVERRGKRIASRPLAGTTEQGSFRTDEALRRSQKDADEHRLVVEEIKEALTPHCSRLDVPDQPELVHLRNVVHLGTTVTGSLRTGSTGGVPTALELVAVLHPTPAVGGVPRSAAVRMINQLESGPRGHYSGPVGFVDADGDGTWVVGIRAATLHGDTARLTAGVGIVARSEPAGELAETDLKLRAVLDILTAAEGVAEEMQSSTA